MRFRAIGTLIGLGTGIFLLIRNPPMTLMDYIDNTIPETIFIPLVGLILGLLIDYVVLSGSRVFNSIYRCEVIIWITFGIVLGIVLAICKLGAEVVFPIAIGMPISLNILYLFYLFLWRQKKPWNWILLFFFGALFFAFSFLVIGDAVRRIAALFYRGEKPVRFAFGGLTQPEALKVKGPIIKTVVVALAVLALYGGIIYWIVMANTPPVL